MTQAAHGKSGALNVAEIGAQSNGEGSEEARILRPSRWRGPLILAAPVVIIIGALYFYLTGGRIESTENAQLQTGMVSISASVSGKVQTVAVSENQLVRKGDVLFTVSSDNYQAAVAEAEAELADTRSEVGSKRAEYQQSLAETGGAEARLAFAEGEAARQRSLLAEGISSRSQYDAAVTEARIARDTISAMRAKSESLRAGLSGNVTAPAESQPDVQRAAAQVARARIGLRDTVVRAPQDGIVTKVHQLQVGNYVTAGRPVFMLTGTKYWVVANFKENQLKYMRVGQPVKISVDAFGNAEIKGHVVSFSPGTGNSFAILPAENATGNWVKVVQRLPVEIAIDSVPAGLQLHMGLSADVEVDTGHKRNLFGPDTPPQDSGQPRAKAPVKP